jgi:hypothetical protein
MKALFANQSEAIEFNRRNGYTVVKSKLANVTFAFQVTPSGRMLLKAWKGSVAVKTAFYISFQDQAKAEAYAAKFATVCANEEKAKTQRQADKKAKRQSTKASDFWAVGDCVYTSWGYDQTNVDFYQITEVKARSVVVRAIAANSNDQGGPCGGKKAPRRFEFVGPEILCPIDENGRFSAGKVYNDHKTPSYRHTCHKWVGAAVSCSSYA